MMYVVPRGDQLERVRPAQRTRPRVPGALSALAGLKKLGAASLALGVLAAGLHYLGFGPQAPEEDDA